MKIPSYKIEEILPSVTTGSQWSLLVYGQNHGLVEYICNRFIEQLNGGDASILKLNAIDVESNPNIIANEIANMGMFATQKIIVILQATNKTFNAINVALEVGGKNIKPNEVFLIICAEELDLKSKLRAFYEKQDHLISCQCYTDDERATTAVVLDFFTKMGIKAGYGVVQLIVAKSSGDRGELLNNLNNLDLFLGNERKIVNAEDVNALFSDVPELEECALADACGIKDPVMAIKVLAQLTTQEVSYIFLVRMLIGHFLKLRRSIESIKNGTTIEEVVRLAKIFFKRENCYKKQCVMWGEVAISNLVYALADLELFIKKNQQSELFCQTEFERFLMRIKRF